MYIVCAANVQTMIHDLHVLYSLMFQFNSNKNHNTAMPVFLLYLYAECELCSVSITLRLESTHHTAGRTSTVQEAPSGKTSGLLFMVNQYKAKT